MKKRHMNKAGFLKEHWLIVLLIGLALGIIGFQYLSEGIYSNRLNQDEATQAIAYQSGIAEARRTGALTKPYSAVALEFVQPTA